MQKKSLLVALFCGALCLTGCLKNEESASVAQVRIAKANELNSIADLNKAKAAAEAVYAQAELTVAQAEAKLREANANLVNAQAETEKVRAELLKVQVKLAEVVVEEERVKLQLLEADLEKHLAEVEAAVAKAEAEKQGWINVMEHAVADAERQALVDAKAILLAQDDLQKYILTQEGAKADSAKAAGAKYFAALRQIQALQLRSIETKAQKALVEAGALEIRDAIHYGIDKIDEEIAKKETLLAYLKEYQEMTPEEAEAALLEARKELTDAYNAYKAAVEVKDAADDALNGDTDKGITGIKNMTADYTLDWKGQFKDEFKTYVEGRQGSDVYYGGHKKIDGVQYYGVTVADEDDDETNNAFIPLWTTLKDPKTGNYNKWAAVKEDPKRYPDIDVYAAGDFIDLNNRTYVPAKIEFDNVKEVLDGLVAEATADFADNDEWYEEKYIPALVEYADKAIAEINDTLPLHQAYVAERKAAVTAAETAYLKAVSDAAKSKADKEKAWNAFQNYMLTKYDVSRKLFEEQWAAQKKNDAAAGDTTSANADLRAAKQGVKSLEAALEKAIEDEAKAEGAWRKAKKAWEQTPGNVQIIANWENWQKYYNPKFDYTAKFKAVETPQGPRTTSYWNVDAQNDTIPGTKAGIRYQDDLALAIIVLQEKEQAVETAQEQYWRGILSEAEFKDITDARDKAQDNVDDLLTKVAGDATKYGEAKLAYDDARKALKAAGEAWNEDYAHVGDSYSAGYADQSVNGSTNHKYKEVTIEGQKVKAWVNGVEIAGTAQAERDTAWTKLRDAKKLLVVTNDYAWNATVPQDATVAEIAKYKENVSAHWAAELKTANSNLVTALGIKKIDDLDDTQAKALYDAFVAAKVEDKTAKAKTDLQKAYNLFNPDEIAELDENPVDDKYKNNPGNAQYSWLLSSYHVDYEAKMIDFETDKFVPIASKLYPGKNLKDFRGRDVLDENGEKLPNYAHSLAYQLERWNAYKAETPERIAKYKAKNAEKLADFKKDIQELAAKVNSFKAHEATYLSWIESLNEGEAALDEAKKAEFDAKLVKDDAQAAYDALEATANGKMWIYVGKSNEYPDGFKEVPVNEAIKQLEGDTKDLFVIRGGLMELAGDALAATADQKVTGKEMGAILKDIAAINFENLNSIAGLNFTKALLQKALQVGKVTLQVVLDAFDAELAVIDEEIALQTKVAETYKAIMNGWLGIVPNDESETAPVDGEGEGDDEE